MHNSGNSIGVGGSSATNNSSTTYGMTPEQASREFDVLRREATKLERHLEDRVARYQQVSFYYCIAIICFVCSISCILLLCLIYIKELLKMLQQYKMGMLSVVHLFRVWFISYLSGYVILTYGLEQREIT